MDTIEATQAMRLSDFEDDTDDETPEGPKKLAGHIKIPSQKGIPETLLPVYEGTNIIGRDNICDITIPSKALSKEHAYIEVKGASHLIWDKNSRNKSRRGKIYLLPEVRYELRDGDKLTFADINCVYQFADKKAPTTEDSGSETGSESMLAPDDSPVGKKKIIYVEDKGSDASSDILQPTQPYGRRKTKQSDFLGPEAATLAYALDSEEESEDDSPSGIPFGRSKGNIVAETPVGRPRKGPVTYIPDSGSEAELDASDHADESTVIRRHLAAAVTQAYVEDSDDSDATDPGDAVIPDSQFCQAPTQAYPGMDLEDLEATPTEEKVLSRQSIKESPVSKGTVPYDMDVDATQNEDLQSKQKRRSKAAEGTVMYDMDVESTQGAKEIRATRNHSETKKPEKAEADNDDNPTETEEEIRQKMDDMPTQTFNSDDEDKGTAVKLDLGNSSTMAFDDDLLSESDDEPIIPTKPSKPRGKNNNLETNITKPKFDPNEPTQKCGDDDLATQVFDEDGTVQVSEDPEIEDFKQPPTRSRRGRGRGQGRGRGRGRGRGKTGLISANEATQKFSEDIEDISDIATQVLTDDTKSPSSKGLEAVLEVGGGKRKQNLHNMAASDLATQVLGDGEIATQVFEGESDEAGIATQVLADPLGATQMLGEGATQVFADPIAATQVLLETGSPHRLNNPLANNDAQNIGNCPTLVLSGGKSVRGRKLNKSRSPSPTLATQVLGESDTLMITDHRYPKGRRSTLQPAMDDMDATQVFDGDTTQIVEQSQTPTLIIAKTPAIPAKRREGKKGKGPVSALQATQVFHAGSDSDEADKSIDSIPALYLDSTPDHGKRKSRGNLGDDTIVYDDQATQVLQEDDCPTLAVGKIAKPGQSNMSPVKACLSTGFDPDQATQIMDDSRTEIPLVSPIRPGRKSRRSTATQKVKEADALAETQQFPEASSTVIVDDEGFSEPHPLSGRRSSKIGKKGIVASPTDPTLAMDEEVEESVDMANKAMGPTMAIDADIYSSNEGRHTSSLKKGKGKGRPPKKRMNVSHEEATVAMADIDNAETIMIDNVSKPDEKKAPRKGRTGGRHKGKIILVEDETVAMGADDATIAMGADDATVAIGIDDSTVAMGVDDATVAMGPDDATVAMGPDDATVAMGPDDATVAMGPDDATVAMGPDDATVDMGHEDTTVVKGPDDATVAMDVALAMGDVRKGKAKNQKQGNISKGKELAKSIAEKNTKNIISTDSPTLDIANEDSPTLDPTDDGDLAATQAYEDGQATEAGMSLVDLPGDIEATQAYEKEEESSNDTVPISEVVPSSQLSDSEDDVSLLQPLRIDSLLKKSPAKSAMASPDRKLSPGTAKKVKFEGQSSSSSAESEKLLDQAVVPIRKSRRGQVKENKVNALTEEEPKPGPSGFHGGNDKRKEICEAKVEDKSKKSLTGRRKMGHDQQKVVESSEMNEEIKEVNVVGSKKTELKTEEPLPGRKGRLKRVSNKKSPEATTEVTEDVNVDRLKQGSNKISKETITEVTEEVDTRRLKRGSNRSKDVTVEVTEEVDTRKLKRGSNTSKGATTKVTEEVDAAKKKTGSLDESSGKGDVESRSTRVKLVKIEKGNASDQFQNQRENATSSRSSSRGRRGKVSTDTEIQEQVSSHRQALPAEKHKKLGTDRDESKDQKSDTGVDTGVKRSRNQRQKREIEVSHTSNTDKNTQGSDNSEMKSLEKNTKEGKRESPRDMKPPLAPTSKRGARGKQISGHKEDSAPLPNLDNEEMKPTTARRGRLPNKAKPSSEDINASHTKGESSEKTEKQATEKRVKPADHQDGRRCLSRSRQGESDEKLTDNQEEATVFQEPSKTVSGRRVRSTRKSLAEQNTELPQEPVKGSNKRRSAVCHGVGVEPKTEPVDSDNESVASSSSNSSHKRRTSRRSLAQVKEVNTEKSGVKGNSKTRPSLRGSQSVEINDEGSLSSQEDFVTLSKQKTKGKISQGSQEATFAHSSRKCSKPAAEVPVEEQPSSSRSHRGRRNTGAEDVAVEPPAVSKSALSSGRKNKAKRAAHEDSQNSLDTVTSSQNSTSSESSRKRQRTGNSSVPSTPPNRGAGPRAVHTPTLRRTTLSRPKVMFTGFVDEEGQKIVKSLGGELVDSISECTHLVTDQVRRTVKFLCGVAQGLQIVSPVWLDNCKDSGYFLDASPYLVKDKANEKKFKFSLACSLEKAAECNMLEGYAIHTTCNVRPEPINMKEIILCTGAKCLNTMPSKFAEKTVVISCEKDKALCKPAITAGIPIVTAEFILTGVLRQELNITAYCLFKSNEAVSSSDQASRKRATADKGDAGGKRKRR